MPQIDTWIFPLQFLYMAGFYTLILLPYFVLAMLVSMSLTVLLRRWPAVATALLLLALAPIAIFVAYETAIPPNQRNIELMPALFVTPGLLGWIAGILVGKLALRYRHRLMALVGWR